ncbi:MAG: hypothetical protein WAQ57_02040 [Candidatus Saccharimonadales bacterium]
MPNKKVTAKTPARTTQKARVRKLSRKHKKVVVKKNKKIPNSIYILRQSFGHIWQNKRVFAGILLIFAIFYVTLVKGLATEFKLDEASRTIDEVVGDGIGTPTKAVALLGTLFGTTGSTTGDAANVYQIVLFIIVSLAIIWTLRQTFDGRTKLRIRDAYFKSMSPFITYIVVSFIILVQCIPALVGILVYSLVAGGGLAVGAAEQVLWLSVLIGSILVSGYFISSSLFASYIVTLPNMTPLLSLRSAKKLVRYRRLSVLRKVLFLPIFVLLCFIIIFLPLVILVPVLAEILFAILSFSLILLGHTYFYVLYRELL